MSIKVDDYDPHALISIGDLRTIGDSIDYAIPEIEAGVADGDIKEEVLVNLIDAAGLVDKALRGNIYKGE